MPKTIPQPTLVVVCYACCGDPDLRPRCNWLAAYVAGRVTREDLAKVFARIVVITKFQLVPVQDAA